MVHRFIFATGWRPYSLRILTLFNFILLILLAVSLVFLLKSFRSASSRQEHPLVSSLHDSSPASVKKDIQEYEVILRNNPFGFPAGHLKSLSSPSSRTIFSEIKLLGTISGRSIDGYAILADKDGKQVMFKTGEMVFGSGKLKKVEKYRVFIDSNGRLHEIMMTEAILADESPGKGKPGFPAAVRNAGQGQYILDQKAVQSTLNKPHQIMTDAKLIPNVVGGVQEGFLLQGVKKNGIYDNLGMQNGDVLVSINNFRISNPENALQAFMALKGMDRIQLDLIRGGNRMTMTYQVR